MRATALIYFITCGRPLLFILLHASGLRAKLRLVCIEVLDGFLRNLIVIGNVGVLGHDLIADLLGDLQCDGHLDAKLLHDVCADLAKGNHGGRKTTASTGSLARALARGSLARALFG